MAYAIEIRDVAFEELQAIKPFYRSRIIQAIREQLTHEPGRATRHRKSLEGVQPDFEHDAPIWELRVGAYRVYYDIDQQLNRVVVRAIREKPPHATTEQVI